MLLLRQTAACTGARRYTLHRAANPDTRNHYPLVRPPNNRLFLGWNSSIRIYTSIHLLLMLENIKQLQNFELA